MVQILRYATRALVPIMLATAIFVAGLNVGSTRGVPFVSKRSVWSIGIFEGPSPLALSPSELTSNPVLTARDVRDRKARFVADPFMINHNGTWYMFLEVLDSQSRQGDIGLATSRDGRAWVYERIVLDEPFHLSYPLVFRVGEEYYLVPESSKVRSVRLYRAVHFPYTWTFVQNLLSGEAYADPTIVRFQDRWWMFTYTNPGTLHLHYASSLLEPWQMHRRSPVIAGNDRLARPGGRMLIWQGKLIRFAQDDEPVYGRAVRAFEILELTPSTYRERELLERPVLSHSGNGWNADGMHQIDAHQVVPGHWIAVVDGRRDSLQWGWRR